LKPLFLGNFVKIRSGIFQFIMLFTLHKLTRLKTKHSLLHGGTPYLVV